MKHYISSPSTRAVALNFREGVTREENENEATAREAIAIASNTSYRYHWSNSLGAQHIFVTHYVKEFRTVPTNMFRLSHARLRHIRHWSIDCSIGMVYDVGIRRTTETTLNQPRHGWIVRTIATESALRRAIPQDL